MYFREEAFGLWRPDQLVDVGHAFQRGQALFIGGRDADCSICLQADAKEKKKKKKKKKKKGVKMVSKLSEKVKNS